MKIPTRRDFFKFGVAAAAISVPAIGNSEPTDTQDRIQHHADALLALIRGQFPEGASRVHVVVSAGAAGDAACIESQAMMATWQADDHMRNGGFWTEKSLGHWSPAVGRY